MSSLLYLSTDTIERIPAESVREFADYRVQFLDLSEIGVLTELPVDCRPGDKGMTKSYKEAAKYADNRLVMFYADQFDELLAACDVMISGSSTTVMQATLLGRATISANFSEEPSSYPYVEHGASLPARNPQELSHSLDVLLSNDAFLDGDTRRQTFFSRHLGPTTEGRGANALLEFIRPLLARGETDA